MEKTDHVSIFCDGSVVNDAGGWAVWLMLVTRNERLKRQAYGQIKGYVKSLEAEVIAAVAGLNMLRAPSIVTVFTDNERIADEYRITGHLDWLNLPASLKTEVKRVSALHTVSFAYVKGHGRHRLHSKNEYNDWCHQWARECARRALEKRERQAVT